MNKILIVGIVASGKTTLARQMSRRMDIPWYELDSIVHHRTVVDGRTKRTPDEQVAVIMEIDRGGSWIFEGVDRSSYQCLYDLADTIIFLDTPLWKRKIRIFTRYLKQQLGREKCEYKSDWTMLRNMYKWTRDFERKRGEFEAKIALYEDKLIWVRGRKELSQVGM
jgi:adenylate kinase family enzyme